MAGAVDLITASRLLFTDFQIASRSPALLRKSAVLSALMAGAVDLIPASQEL